MSRIRIAAPLSALLLCSLAAQAQQGGPKGGGRRGPMGPDPLEIDDRAGFESIFDGTLNNWDGDKDFWRAENGTIVGESTKEKPLQRNTFLIYRGAAPADFELKLDFKMNSTNSGVQYRSVEMPDAGKWVLKGYQADFDFTNVYTGQLYEERGRGFLAMRGQATRIKEGEKARVIGNIKSGDDIKGVIKINDWNTLHVIARGNVTIHILNGQVSSVTIDEDTKNRKLDGLIGIQLHVGPPMKAEYRNIYLRKL